MRQHHYEVYVTFDDDGTLLPGPDLNGELSASWWDGPIWDDATEKWTAWMDDESPVACAHLVQWLDFPYTVRRIFQRWTDDDGWDINIMSDIMRELIRIGAVRKDDPIAE